MKQYHKKHISHYHINYSLKYKQPPTSRCISHGIIEGLKPSLFKLILIQRDRVARLRTEFEDQWHRDERGTGGPIKYPVELAEVQELAEWVREAV